MKTTIEINGYEIVIEEIDGLISVSAVKDDEVIEEFEIQSGAQSQSEDSEEVDTEFDGGQEVQDFEEFGSEEESDEDSENDEDSEEDEDEKDEENEEESDEVDESDEERKLESFQSFLKKRK